MAATPHHLRLLIAAIIIICCSSFCPPVAAAEATSGHRCPSGDDWYQYNGNCYFWSSRTEGWFGAQKHCEALGGHLVSIGSRAENSFLHALAECNKDFWTGMVKTESKTRGFTWWDDSRKNYTEMLTIRTNDFHDCVYFDSDQHARWYNVYCQYPKHFVCVTAPSPADEARESASSAGDDAGAETGRAPESDAKNQCPNGWLSLENNCYFVSAEKTNYFNAQMACEAKGAIVAKVTSAREQTLLTMSLGCNVDAWIGLEKTRPCVTNAGQPFCWVWMDRTPLTYSAWSSGFPSTSKEIECVVTDGRWRTTNCYNDYRYICKKH